MLTPLPAPVPASCLTETWLSTATDKTVPNLVIGNPYNTDCWPLNHAPKGTTTYSPAICPEGYVSACDIDPASRRDSSETAWACCPIGFHCDGGVFSCASTISENSTFFPSDLDADGSTVTTEVYTYGFDFNAHSVLVAFHSEDFYNTPTTVSAEVPTSTTTATTNPIATVPKATGAPDVEPPKAPDSGNLPTGAIAGIVIGSVLGLVLVAGAFWAIRRQRNRVQHLPYPYHSQDEPKPEQPTEQPIHHTYPTYPAYPRNPQIPHIPQPETDSIMTPVELNSAPGPYELGTQPHRSNFS
ncbi:hypothetical protein F4808DRAFT_425232 [Astrocystis sublimbata]|nr:hypothetical protein F4808DRAFT_425232 [Astrocystis sublimbata]